jgi:periplasmic divalent cation tolerance protein
VKGREASAVGGYFAGHFDFILADAVQMQNKPKSVKAAAQFVIVLVTAPDLKTARKLARAALSARLTACANLVPKIESHYRRRGKIESGTEVLLILKTQKPKLAALEKLILARHPYDTPEFLVLPVSAGNENYLEWLTANCR